MSSSREVLFLELNKEIGITKSKLKNNESLNLPTVAQYVDESRIFVFDPKNESHQSFIINRNKEIIWKQRPVYIEQSNVKFRYLKMLKENTFLGIDLLGEKIIEFDDKGKILKLISIPLNSKAVSVDKDDEGNYLVLDFTNRKIIQYDQNNNLNWEYSSNVSNKFMLEPCFISSLNNESVLIVDEELHTVFEICKKTNEIIWRYGEVNNPGTDNGHLTYPQFALRSRNKKDTIISDSQNNRILSVNKSGQIQFLYENSWESGKRNNNLFWPTYIDESMDGKFLITDTKNSRIIEVNKLGVKEWEYGYSNILNRTLSFPRSIQKIENGNLLLADTHHNRVIEIDENEKITWSYGETKELFWPRGAIRKANGETIIADGRNGRILTLSSQNEVIFEITSFKYLNKSIKFKDPHHIELLNNGNILIVDSDLGVVVELNQHHTIWVFGLGKDNKLNDPHSAIRINDFTFIADSGNNRILKISKYSEVEVLLNSFYYFHERIILTWPRCMCISPSGNLFIVDGGTGLGMELDLNGNLLKTYSSKNEEILKAMGKARSMEFLSDDEIYISDNLNSRILKVKVC